MSPKPPTPPTCKGTKKDGTPCTATTLDAAGFCFAHSPSREAERAEARAKGGRNSSSLARISKLVPARLGPIFERLERVMVEVHEGTLEPARANALANVARAAAAVLTSGEIEQRLRDLEERSEAA